MNTHQLQCFLCVADRLNFTKAAEELYLSTPTVTHHIQSLEAELNTKLFIRNKKSVRLTEAGMVFYNDASDIMEKVNLSKEHAEKMHQVRFSIIRIGCSSQAELETISETLIQFRSANPKVIPRVILANYSQLIHMLNDKQLDIVYGTKDMMKDITNYTFKTIKKIMSYAIMELHHPLSNHKVLSYEQLQHHRFITLHPKMIPFKYGSKIQDIIRLHAQDNLDIVCENDQVSIAMAIAGYGIAILPEFCLTKSNQASYCKIPLAESEEFEYGIAYQSRSREDSIHLFISLCVGK